MVDLEKGQQGHRHRRREEDPPPATVADALFAMDEEDDIRIATDKAIKCILRVRSTSIALHALVICMDSCMIDRGM